MYPRTADGPGVPGTPHSAGHRIETIWLALGPILRRVTLAILFAIAGMWVFAYLAHEVDDGGTKWFDSTVIAFFQAHQWPPLHAVMRAISTVAGPNVQTYIALAGVIGFLIARKFWPDGLTLLVAGAGGALLMVGLKLLFHRPRPTEIFTERLGYSFPSGHSFFAVVLYGLAAYWIARDRPKRQQRAVWMAAIFAMALVGFSRIYLGEHYPSDVAAGYSVAVPWLWGCLALPTAFHRRSGKTLTLEERRTIYESGRAQLQSAAAFLPALADLTQALGHDPRIPGVRRIALRLVAGYTRLRYDLVPDPAKHGLGAVDDFVLINATLRRTAKAHPDAAREHWQGKTDLLPLLDRIQGGLQALTGTEPALAQTIAASPATPTTRRT